MTSYDLAPRDNELRQAVGVKTSIGWQRAYDLFYGELSPQGREARVQYIDALTSTPRADLTTAEFDELVRLADFFDRQQHPEPYATRDETGSVVVPASWYIALEVLETVETPSALARARRIAEELGIESSIPDGPK